MGSESDMFAELPSSLAVAQQEMFPDAKPGKPSRRIRKRVQLLRNAEDVLERCLQPGETVRYVTAGSQLIALQFLTIGWFTEYINRTTLVLTDTRLLLIHTNSRRFPEMYANQIALDRFKDVAYTLFSLRFSTSEGELSFSGVSGFDKRQIVELVATNPNATGGVQHLCPRCFHAREAPPPKCSHCDEETKSPDRAGWLSLLFPGLGDFYLGHRGLAALEIAGAAALWLVTLLIVAVGFAARDSDGVVSGSPFIIAVVAAHIFDSLVTRQHAQRGLYSMDGELPTGLPIVPEGYVPIDAGDLGTAFAPRNGVAGDAPARTRRKPRRSSTLRAAVTATVLVLLGVGGWLYLSLWTSTSQPSPQELTYVTVGEDLYEWFGDLELDPASAVTAKERYLDGTYEIWYEHESEDIYVNSFLTVNRTPSDATTTMDTAIAAFKIAYGLEDGAELVEVPDFYDWGDDSAFYLVENQYGTGGNVFVARSGVYVYSLQLIGLYFDDADSFAELVSSPLNNIIESPPPRRSRVGLSN